MNEVFKPPVSRHGTVWHTKLQQEDPKMWGASVEWVS
jgi:hypothetical protein